jgi:hypothetical protein
MPDPSLAQKLGVGSEGVVALVHAPESFVLELPRSTTLRHRARGRADVVLAFFTRRHDLQDEIERLGTMIYPAGSLWIAWPKRSSGRRSDLSDHAVRETALPLGLVDNQVCALDETWSALRLVWRSERRR